MGLCINENLQPFLFPIPDPRFPFLASYLISLQADLHHALISVDRDRLPIPNMRRRLLRLHHRRNPVFPRNDRGMLRQRASIQNETANNRERGCPVGPDIRRDQDISGMNLRTPLAGKKNHRGAGDAQIVSGCGCRCQQRQKHDRGDRGRRPSPRPRDGGR